MKHKFKIGDKVRVIKANYKRTFKKGDILTVLDNCRTPYCTLLDTSIMEGLGNDDYHAILEEKLELVEQRSCDAPEVLEEEIDHETHVKAHMEAENRIEEQSSDVCVSTTGALRYNSDKPQLSQIDPLFLLGLADLMTISAKKYSKWNYAKGQNLTTVCDSMSRHLLSFLNGENDDTESGKSHLLHIAANCIIAYSTTSRHLEKHPELDDRINKFLTELDK